VSLFRRVLAWVVGFGVVAVGFLVDLLYLAKHTGVNIVRAVVLFPPVVLVMDPEDDYVSRLHPWVERVGVVVGVGVFGALVWLMVWGGVSLVGRG
jgi:hypothetical protein